MNEEELRELLENCIENIKDTCIKDGQENSLIDANLGMCLSIFFREIERTVRTRAINLTYDLAAKLNNLNK